MAGSNELCGLTVITEICKKEHIRGNAEILKQLLAEFCETPVTNLIENADVTSLGGGQFEISTIDDPREGYIAITEDLTFYEFDGSVWVLKFAGLGDFIATATDNGDDTYTFTSFDGNTNFTIAIPILSIEAGTGIEVDVTDLKRPRVGLNQATQNTLSELQNEIEALKNPYYFIDVNIAPYTKSSATGDLTNPVTASYNDINSIIVNPSDISTLDELNNYSIVINHGEKYESYLVDNINTTTGVITIIGELKYSVVDSFDMMHESVNNQHLSRYGYIGLSQYLYRGISGHNKKNYIYKLNTQFAKTSSYSDPIAYDLSDVPIAEFVPIGGAVAGGFIPGSDSIPNAVGGIQTLSISHQSINSRPYKIRQGIAGAGVKLDVDLSNKGGGIDVFVGINFRVINAGDPTIMSRGGAEVKLVKDGSVLFSKIVLGAVEKIEIPYDGSFTSAELHIITISADPTCIFLSGIYIWEGSLEYGQISSSLISFLGDSWTQFPIPEGSEAALPRPDGTPGEGMQYLSEKMKEYAFGNGVIFQTENWGRGGQTSEWGNYWKEKVGISSKYVVIMFYINDYNSRNNVPSTPSIYDFDPNDMWASLDSDLGGQFGSVDVSRWLNNLIEIINYYKAKGVIPIVLHCGHTGSSSQSANMLIVWHPYFYNIV